MKFNKTMYTNNDINMNINNDILSYNMMIFN